MNGKQGSLGVLAPLGWGIDCLLNFGRPSRIVYFVELEGKGVPHLVARIVCVS